MFCSKCGSQLLEGSAFCSNCGHRVAPITKPPAPQPIAQPNPIPQPVPVQKPAPVQQPIYQQPPVYQPEAQQWPIPQTKPAKPPKQKKERKPLPRPTGGTKALTILLCIFMALCLVFASLISTVRSLFTEDVLYDVLDEVEFSELTFTAANGEAQTLADAINESVVNRTPNYIYDAANSIGIIELDDDDIDAIFSTDEVREFIVDIILGYTDYFIYGDRMIPISAEDIADFVIDHDWLIFEETGKVVSFAERDIMIEEMERYFDFETIESRGDIEDTIGFSLTAITFVFSTLYYILLALAIVCFILIIVLNRKNLPACMTKVGVTSIVFAVWMLLIGIGMLISGNFIGDLPFVTFISAILSQVTSYFLIWSAVALVLGLALILVRKYLLKPRFE